jgi:hypothetical protein
VLNDVGWGVNVGALEMVGALETVGEWLGAGEIVGASESHLGKVLMD